MTQDPLEAVKAYCKENRWRQGDLAQEFSMSNQAVSYIFCRHRKMSLRFIRGFHRIAPDFPVALLLKDYEL